MNREDLLHQWSASNESEHLALLSAEVGCELELDRWRRALDWLMVVPGCRAPYVQEGMVLIKGAIEAEGERLKNRGAALRAALNANRNRAREFQHALREHDAPMPSPPTQCEALSAFACRTPLAEGHFEMEEVITGNRARRD